VQPQFSGRASHASGTDVLSRLGRSRTDFNRNGSGAQLQIRRGPNEVKSRSADLLRSQLVLRIPRLLSQRQLPDQRRLVNLNPSRSNGFHV